MTKCICVYCGDDFIEELSNAVESTLYCSPDCERDDDSEENE